LRLVLEVILIACVLGVFALRASVRAWLAATSRPFLVVCAILLAGLVAGHLSRNRGKAFPFVYWYMYTQPETAEVIEHLHITAITTRGERFELNGAHVFPSLGLGTFRLYSRLLGVAYDPLVADKPDARALLRGIALGYERLHPERRLGSIALEMVTTPYTKARYERRVIAAVELP
jgi:hypothetical protein